MKRVLIAILLVGIFVANFAFLPKAFAGTLTDTSILETGGTSNANPMIAGDGQQVMVDFTAATTGTPGSISLDFNSFSGGSVTNGSITMDTTTCTAYFPGVTGLPGSSLTATGNSGTATITLGGTLGAETSGTNYCFSFTSVSTVTNPSTPGVYSALLTVGSDSNNAAFDVLASSANNFSITAVIAPTFTLSLSSTTDTITALSPTINRKSTGINATVSTNGLSGWFLWAEDANAGLTSTQNGHTIGSVSTSGNHTMTTGSDQYALGVTVDNTSNYAYSSGATGGGLSNTAFNEIATNNAAANGLVTTLHELVDVSATTPPATDYTDTITVIGAGSF